MRQDLLFEQYVPEIHGYPPFDSILWGEWPPEIDQQEEVRLVNVAGFHLDQRYRKGILFREWTSKTGRKHPIDSLIVVPHINFTAFTPNEHFAVSHEKVQRME